MVSSPVFRNLSYPQNPSKIDNSKDVRDSTVFSACKQDNYLANTDDEC